MRRAPYFDGMGKAVEGFAPISGARVLANLGDFITTDHISPAGSIASDSPAAKYLAERGSTRLCSTPTAPVAATMRLWRAAVSRTSS